MTTTYPNVSIIVPIYNTELYLEDCLNSIINQTYQQIEIILIDDGSTDRSCEIMNIYAEKDKRIIIHSQPNRGVSAARNAGLAFATGEYILFVDSDDTIHCDTIEKLCRQAILTAADIIIGNVFFCYPDGKRIPLFHRMAVYSNLSSLSGEQCFSLLVEASVFPPLVYLYFVKRTFIQKNQLYFEEGIVHEDELWCVKTLIHAMNVSIMDFFYYYYREREGSIMHSDNKKYRISSFIKVVNALEIFASELHEKQQFIQAIGYIYIRIFYIYHLIGLLLYEMKEISNNYMDYFAKLLETIYPTLSYTQQRACSDYFRSGSRRLFLNNSGITLSFCITCKNRLYQIKQTLPQNLEDNRISKDIVEFVLVDFGSTDGLQEWIADNFVNEIEEGYLKYYYTEELSSWHTSIAKNTSHMLAQNAIVVNLDCDNFTGKEGGVFVIEKMIKYGWDKIILHQFGNEYGDGTHGRIAISKANFIKLGGYDESFEPAGYQDNDMLIRAQLMRLNYIHLPDVKYTRAIPNSHEVGVVNTLSDLSWEEMDERNYHSSLKNITAGKLKANDEKKYIGIVDNIYTFEKSE
jgi:glycosyltransferase involved in cell wall biosynthesis